MNWLKYQILIAVLCWVEGATRGRSGSDARTRPTAASLTAARRDDATRRSALMPPGLPRERSGSARVPLASRSSLRAQTSAEEPRARSPPGERPSQSAPCDIFISNPEKIAFTNVFSMLTLNMLWYEETKLLREKSDELCGQTQFDTRRNGSRSLNQSGIGSL